MDRDELLGALTEDILAYVMHGEVSERHLVNSLKRDDITERFEDFDRLVRLHFVLRPDVVDFVERLPKRLRGIKTQTRNVSKRSRGRVNGRIDWHATTRERVRSSPSDPTLFVCNHRSEDYDIPENLVLKALLSVIYRALEECEPYLDREYEWMTDRWVGNGQLVDSMRDIFERNVHVSRIRDPGAYEPTARMLERAGASRQPIYREAARLLREFRSASRGEHGALEELLRETAITPDDDETLFELFVLFRFVEAIESFADDSFDLRPIESGSQQIARLVDGSREVTLYHDSSGDRGLSFRPDEPNKATDALSRTEFVNRATLDVANGYFEDRQFRTVTGRPDVILLEVTDNDERQYLITEVKNSARTETIRQGIRETLEYLAFMRRNDSFVFDDETDYVGTEWNGLLVVQDLPGVETAELDDQRLMKILQAGEVEPHLDRIISTVLDY